MIGIYELNNIYHADSYKAIKNLPEKSVDCIYVDIPYLYASAGVEQTKGSGVAQRISRLNTKDLDGIRDGIDYGIFKEFKRIMKKVNLFIWCSKMQIPDILNYWLDYGDINFEILVWTKTNPTPATNNTWLPDIEYCLYFREKGVRLNDGYEIKSKWYNSPINKKDKDFYDHPTIKPLEFVKNHLLHATQEGDVVVDFFLGSGTTCVASKEINRKYLGFEYDKEYYDIARDRLDGVDQIARKQMEQGQIALF